VARTLFTSRANGDLKDPANKAALARLLSLPTLLFMKQSHSDLVAVVDEYSEQVSCDAMVTTVPGVGIAALAADCLPITFDGGNVIGVAHAGRLGVGSQIAVKTVLKMREFGAGEIRAMIGPSICGKCYEVSPEMYEEFCRANPAARTSDALHALDLRAAVRAQLEAEGVEVSDVGICTLENDLYFSHRRGGEPERQAGIISL